MTTPCVYAVVLNYNGIRWLANCLETLSASDYSNLSIVIVDNASNDGSVEFVKKNFPKTYIIENKKNLGFAEGSNVGIRYALAKHANYVGLLNNDIKFDSQWLSSLIEVGEENNELGILGPVIYNYNGSKFDSIFMQSIGQKTNFLKDLHKNAVAQFYCVDWIIGTTMLVKKKVFEKVGLFDPIYFLFHEERDFCRRARFHGFKVAVVPKSKVYHYYGGSCKEDTRNYLNIRNELIYFLKTPDNSILNNFNIYARRSLAKIRDILFSGNLIELKNLIIAQIWILSNLNKILYRRRLDQRGGII